jgi:hypothetical protein
VLRWTATHWASIPWVVANAETGRARFQSR